MALSWFCRNGHTPMSLDVKTAVLRGKKMFRTVATWPPPEAGEPEDCVWVLEVPVYGLAEAPRKWYEALDEALLSLKMIRSKTEPTLYYCPTYPGQTLHWKQNPIKGIYLVHVDGILGGGSKEVHEKVTDRLKERFPFGDQENGAFKFTGIQIEEVDLGIKMHQKHYCQAMKEIPVDRDRGAEEPLTWKEQTAYRSLQGAEAWTAIRSQPDACGEVSIGASKNQGAQVQDLKELNKVMKYLKSTVETEVFLPRMHPYGDDATLHLRILCLCDAALMNASEGRSQGARIIWLAEDRECQKDPIKVHLLFWE